MAKTKQRAKGMPVSFKNSKKQKQKPEGSDAASSLLKEGQKYKKGQRDRMDPENANESTIDLEAAQVKETQTGSKRKSSFNDDCQGQSKKARLQSAGKSTASTSALELSSNASTLPESMPAILSSYPSKGNSHTI